jgi:hypothetical protein
MLLVGCTTAPVRLRSVVSVTVPAPVPLPKGASLPEPAPAPFPAVSTPTTIACSLAPRRFTNASLRVSPRGPVFAEVRGASASLTFPVAKAAESAVAELDGSVVLLRAHVAAQDLPLYLQSPAALRGFVYPHPATALEWVGSERGSLEVDLDTSRVLAWPESVRTELSCAALGPSAGEFALRGFITEKKKLPELTVMKSGAGLSLEPNGPPVAGLKAGHVAQVLESRRGARRVIIDHYGYAIVGWVHASDLGTGYGLGYGHLGRSHRVRWRGATRGRTCVHDLDLVARTGDSATRVGKIKARAPFLLLSPVDEAQPSAGPPPRLSRDQRTWRQVSFPQLDWLSLADDAALVVDEAELSSCASP